jgi:hypothetical protein
VESHRDAIPFRVLLASPDQGGGDNIVTVAENIGPYVNRFTDHALHGKAPIVNAGINILNVESVAGDASDHSVWFVHDIDALVSIRTPTTRDTSSQEQARAIYQAREGGFGSIGTGLMSAG